MDLSLQNKRALVCGSSRGIGLAAAQELALLGCNVTLASRNSDRLKQVRSDLDTMMGQSHDFISIDMSDLKTVRSVIQLLVARTTYHILVNNTGGPASGLISKATPEALTSAFTQHILSAQLIAQALLPGMRESGYGRIVNIISTSVKQPIKGLGVSNTIRGAMANWSKTLAGEVAADGITVNNVLPGATQTERLQEIGEARAAKSGVTTADELAKMRSAIPMKRFGIPNEIGGVVAFLATPAAAYITGTNIVVDGGRTSSL